MSFAEYVDSITPEWLTAIVGRFSVTFGQTSDSLSALLRLGARDAMVAEANDDCLNNHISNSEMTAILGEPPFATRSAMTGGRGVVPPGTATALTYPDRWLLHRESGSAAAIADAARADHERPRARAGRDDAAEGRRAECGPRCGVLHCEPCQVPLACCAGPGFRGRGGRAQQPDASRSGRSAARLAQPTPWRQPWNRTDQAM